MMQFLIDNSDAIFYIVEFFLVWIIAFIGAVAHEVIFNHSNDISLKNKNLSIVATVDFLICYAIDPYIIQFHPRLILLPPLIFGLLGNELILRLSTIKGSTSFIEYLLGFLGITNKNEKREFGLKDEQQFTSNQPIEQQNQTEQSIVENEELVTNEDQKKVLIEINEKCRFILNKMDNLLLDYYQDEVNNIKLLVKEYDNIKLFNKNLIQSINQNDYISISIAFKLAEIIKKENELDYIYRSYIQNRKSTLH